MLDRIIRQDLESILKQLDKDRIRPNGIAITGGAGFLGSWLCDILMSLQATVTCIDDFSTGLSRNVAHLLDASKFRLLDLDVSQPNLEFDRHNLILHLASRASPEEYQQHPIETLAANSQGTKNMLEHARKCDATFVYASSSEVYGDAEIIPTPENYWGKVNPVGPRSCYDEGKRFGEALCMAYHRAHSVDVRIVRIFNSYGPRLRSDGSYGRAFSRFIDQALSDEDITVHGTGEQTRSFCYVADTVTAILLAATRNEIEGQVVNVGNPHEVSILELAEKVAAITGTSSKVTFHPRPPDDPQRRCPDISKAKELLGWSPIVTLEEGLRKTIDWFTQCRQTIR